jgi:L-alanine-DL-glutamate epimerase-like enolase superfamily enzyme
MNMSTIQSVQTNSYLVPLEVVLSDSTHGVIPHFELVICKIMDSDGVEGIGYTYAVNSGAAAFHALIEGYLAPAIIGKDPEYSESIWQDMWWKVHYSGRGGHATSAISAIDIAIWDLRAKRASLPLWRLLGGFDPKVPVYAGGIDLDFSIDKLLAQSDRFQNEGFRAIKMKAGRPLLREDIERVKSMRKHLGDDFPLMVDANMKWTVDQAVKAARSLEEFNLLWIEEPTIPDDIQGHVRIVKEGRTSVAAGENLHTLYEFQHLIAAGGVTFPEPDVTNCGGITIFKKIAALAEAHNLPLTSHGVHDLTVHLMASIPNRTYMEIHGFSLDRYIAHPVEIYEGHTVAPERKGHGIEFNWKALAPYKLKGDFLV